MYLILIPSRDIKGLIWGVFDIQRLGLIGTIYIYMQCIYMYIYIDGIHIYIYICTHNEMYVCNIM